eukprot:scaffold10999_cov61-Cylindrotheca_fusiformis.AAC.1
MRDVLASNASTDTLESMGGFHVICDTGCSKFATFDEADFVPGTFQKSQGPKQVISGIAGGLEIEGTGIIDYETMDDFGRVKHLRGE